MNGGSKLTAPPIIYAVSSGQAADIGYRDSSKAILGHLNEAISAGITHYQIREKQLSSKNLFYLSRRCVEITKGTNTNLLINDRADIAFLSGADGVHLPANSLPPDIIRKLFGENFLIGVSTHSLAEANLAEQRGADFITFGPVFHTPSKAMFGEPQGIGKLSEIKQAVSIPLVAIGGIDEKNYEIVLEAGADGFAAIRLFQKTRNLKNLCNEIKESYAG